MLFNTPPNIPTNQTNPNIPTKRRYPHLSQPIQYPHLSQPNQYPPILNTPTNPQYLTSPTNPQYLTSPTNPQYPNQSPMHQPNQYRGENSHRTFQSRGLDHSLRCLVARAPSQTLTNPLTLTPPNRGLSARAHHAHSLDPLTPSLPYPSITLATLLQATLVTYPPFYLSKPAARRLYLSISLSRTIPRSLAPPT